MANRLAVAAAFWLLFAAGAQGADGDAPPGPQPARSRRAAGRPAAASALHGVAPLVEAPRSEPLEGAPGASGAQRPVPASPTAPPVVLRGGTVHTVSGATVERATLVMRDGRIEAIGSGAPAPPGATIVDVTGKHVWPALLHASTVLGLTEVGAVRATNDINEVGDLNPNARAEVAVDADSELLPVTRSNGVLLALSGGRGGLISGTAAVLELDGWGYRDMVLRAPAALLVNWPAMRLDRSPEGIARLPLEKQERARDGEVRKIRDAFEEARSWVAGRGAAVPGASRKDSDVKWEAMASALGREIPVVVRANTILEIKAALKMAEELGLRLVIEGGADVGRVAPELKRKGVAVILGGVMEVGRAWEAYDVNFTTPLKLHEAGVTFCIAPSGDSWNARNLPYVAARAVAFGLPADEAMRAITINPARILGVEQRVGSLEVGKDATLFVSNGDPLDIRSNVEAAYVRGRPIDLSDRHKRLYERWRLKPRRAAGR